jgi:hypothetical protein
VLRCTVLIRNASFLACLQDKALLQLSSSSYWTLSLDVRAISPSTCGYGPSGGFTSKLHQRASTVL